MARRRPRRGVDVRRLSMYRIAQGPLSTAEGGDHGSNVSGARLHGDRRHRRHLRRRQEGRPPKMSCEESLGLSDSVKPQAVAYLDGYTKGGKLKEEDIAEVDVDREVAVLVAACTEEPKKSTKVKMGAADEVDLERDV